MRFLYWLRNLFFKDIDMGNPVDSIYLRSNGFERLHPAKEYPIKYKCYGCNIRSESSICRKCPRDIMYSITHSLTITWIKYAR